MIEIFIPLEKIPSATAQEKGYRVIRGKVKDKVVTYEKDKVKEVRQLYQSYLCHHIPDKPIDGAVRLLIIFCYPGKAGATESGKYNTCWKSTKPDADNMAKMLQDVLTECRYWNDDGQVTWVDIRKVYVEPYQSGIYVGIESLRDDES